MPYRIDLADAGVEAIDRLIDLGALDVEHVDARHVAAVMPDHVAADEIERSLGVTGVRISPAVGRDADSTWVLRPRTVRVGRIRIAPGLVEAEHGVLRLIDAPAFGTGLHPTTALCLEAIDDVMLSDVPHAVLDVGTGSGVLALAALLLGVPRATGLDIDDESLRIAVANAHLNGLSERVELTRGGPDAVTGTWPLVLANIVPASLIDMAPALVRRIGHGGQIVLSGIPVSLEQDVARVYQRLGLRRREVKSSGGWIALIMNATW